MPSLREQLEAAPVGSVALGEWGRYTQVSTCEWWHWRGSLVFVVSGHASVPDEYLDMLKITHIIPPDVLATCRVEVHDAAE